MKHIHLDITDRIATVTLDRPPVNALNAEAFREIGQVFTDLGRSTDASVAIFTAAGEKIFCAGVDLKDSARRHARQLTGDDTVIDLLDPGAVPRNCFEAMRNCPLPVIGAIHGKVIGAGVPLAACCDLLVAAENASFSVPEIRVGVLGGGRHMQRLVGTHKMRRAFFTGEPDMGSLKVSFFGPFYGGYNVIRLDERDYSYSLVCGPAREFLWILSRSREMDEETLRELVEFAADLGFETDRLIYVRHDEKMGSEIGVRHNFF